MFNSKKLDHLLRTKKLIDGKRITHKYVEANSGGVITAGYVSLLRNGDRTNPSAEVIEVLARLLDVDSAEFFVQEKNEPDQDSPVQNQIALRAKQLDSEGRKAVLGMIEYILKKESQGSEP